MLPTLNKKNENNASNNYAYTAPEKFAIQKKSVV